MSAPSETAAKAHWTIEEALARLGTGESPSVRLFRHGSLELKAYAPRGVDPQKPHARDEIYVIMRGTGTFYDGSDRRPFGPGDFLFVPAGVEHRFEEFSDDFATWVVFYGPEGGENHGETR